MQQPQKFDVIVVGAGIMGASSAFRLSDQGLKVAVLEMQASPATGSTARSSAGVRVQFTEEVNIRLSWESIQEYRRFEELYGEDSGYRPIGYLLLVPPERWGVHLESVKLQERLGVPVRVLSIEEAQKIVAFEGTGIAGITHGPADGIIDPHSITLTYLRLARERGASIHMEAPLLSAQQVGTGWQVTTPKGVFEADYLVNTAGPWAGQVAQRAGLEVPVLPYRRMAYMSAPTEWEHSYPLTIDIESGFHFRSEGRRVLFGRSNPDEPAGFSEGVDWEWFEQTLQAGLERFPWFADLRLDRQASWWGYYEVTPDHNPIIGRLPGVENWVNAAGFSGHGVQQASMVGRLVTEEICLGRAQSINIDPLRIERLAQHHERKEYNIV